MNRDILFYEFTDNMQHVDEIMDHLLGMRLEQEVRDGVNAMIPFLQNVISNYEKTKNLILEQDRIIPILKTKLKKYSDELNDIEAELDDM